MKRKFDSVNFQRKTRKKLSAKYPAARTPELLRELKKRYGRPQKQRV